MLNIVIVLLLLFLCAVICALFFAAGVFVGVKLASLKKEKPQDSDKQTEIAKKKEEHEYKNFFSYTGDEQE